MVSDEELAERTRAGDARAFAELWSRHAKAGLAAASQFRQIADPEDIVAEAYLQILRALQRGGGPHEAFRPYLYRTVRNVALGWIPKATSLDIDDLRESLPSDAPDLETSALEKTITVRAFRTLPERWQTILWYTEVEGIDPAEAAPHLGLSPNSAAALAYRAREGLKKAWLQAHVSDQRVPADCRWTTERMADYNRHALSPRARDRFEKHLETCTRCGIIVEEIDEVSGRLAAMLFPLVLGGTAAAALLAGKLAAGTTGPAGSSGSTPSAAATSQSVAVRAAAFTRRPVRTPVIAAAAVVVLAAAGTGAFAASGAFTTAPVPRRSTVAGELPGTTQAQPKPTPQSRSTPAPAPASPAPAAPTPALPVTTPVSPVVAAAMTTPTNTTTVPTAPVTPPVIPPLAPTVTAPADNALLATDRPQLAGTGQPGAVVTIERFDASGTDLGQVATATIDSNGAWATVPTSAIPDGTWMLQFVQADTAGNRSPAATRTVTIDTTVLPPVIGALPPGLLEYLPTITGTAEPFAQVTLFDETNTLIGTATADNAGRWSVPLPDPGRDGQTLTAIQKDLAGNVSQPSAATAPLVFQRPAILAPANGATIAAAPRGTVVTVQVSGTAGQQIQILIDGTWTGNTHTLQPTPIDRVTPPLPNGKHTIGVRYYDPATGQLGSLSTVTFTIG